MMFRTMICIPPDLIGGNRAEFHAVRPLFQLLCLLLALLWDLKCFHIGLEDAGRSAGPCLTTCTALVKPKIAFLHLVVMRVDMVAVPPSSRCCLPKHLLSCKHRARGVDALHLPVSKPFLVPRLRATTQIILIIPLRQHP